MNVHALIVGLILLAVAAWVLGYAQGYVEGRKSRAPKGRRIL